MKLNLIGNRVLDINLKVYLGFMLKRNSEAASLALPNG